MEKIQDIGSNSSLYLSVESETSKSDEVCRFCVGKTSDYSSVFQDDLHGSLKSCFGLMIQETDNWPKFICRQCLNSAKACIDFVSRIREGEKCLRDLYGEWRIIEDIDIKPDIEMVDIKDLPIICYDLRVEINRLEESVVKEKLSKAEPLPKKRGRPRKSSVIVEESSSLSMPTPDNSELASNNCTAESVKPSEKPSKSQLRAQKRQNEKDLKKKILEENQRNIEEFFRMDCHICEESFGKLGDLWDHFRESHKRRGYIFCCDVKLDRPSKILDHRAYHLNPDAFKCHECNNTFKNSIGLKLHKLNSHTPKEEHIFKCPKCPLSFMTEFRFKMHSYVHCREEDKSHFCPDCGKAFAIKGNLKIHIRQMHTKDYYHVCETCARTFKNKDMLLRHMKLHTGEKIETFPCTLCGHRFSHKSKLKLHMKRHIENESGKIFRCAICDKESPNSLALQAHVKYTHIVERKHKCNLCKKSFKKPVNLREHMATHTYNQILYTCLFCPKQFNSNANKYMHQKRKHPKEYQVMIDKKNKLKTTDS
ncbi:transcription factor grauzone-like [Phlebotomus argentipes]|uniref:transcription factor grauzone-like n=1 Tax=Phlebotomus argentipes TaxID=94469 RepID=UPI002892CD47|nr:transcription factor grauzone-like [Phlebotomus argentipes]